MKQQLRHKNDVVRLTGIWHSKYRYTSSSRGKEFEGEHKVRLVRRGRLLILESLPGQKSYLLLRLSLDDDIVTGSWQEDTNPEGYYSLVYKSRLF